MKEEHKLARGHLLATIPQMEKEWRVSFEFMANSFRGLGKSSKKWKFKMAFAIRHQAPPPFMVQISILFFTPLFSFVIKSYIYEMDFTLGLSQNYHF